MLNPGLYEQVINNQLTSELSEIPEARKSVAPIDKAEASKVLAQYLADVVQKGLDNVIDNGGDISAQIALTNQIVALIQNTTKEADFAALGVDQRAEQLLALLKEQDPRLAVGKTAADLSRPETSIAQSSLFTGAIHEPQMYTELKKEIVSADRIDMLVSFIKWSGLRLLSKLTQLVHQKTQTAPFDERNQHINTIRRHDFLLQLRVHLWLMDGAGEQRALRNRGFRTTKIRGSFANS